MQLIELSLSQDKLMFIVDDQRIEVPQGLSWIAEQSLRQDQLDALGIEHAIYVIEEILETLHLSYKTERIATTQDVMMKQVLDLFFHGVYRIDRILLEHAFNDFIERIEFYIAQGEAEHVSIFVYFIFIRELMHHCNVIEIEYRTPL